MGEFRLTRAAQADLDGIGRHTDERWGIAQRDHYLSLLDKAFRQLADNPELGRPRDEVRRNLRGYVCREHIVFYRVVTSDVVVVRVLHHARDIQRML